jgi:hypothetical protein
LLLLLLLPLPLLLLLLALFTAGPLPPPATHPLVSGQGATNLVGLAAHILRLLYPQRILWASNITLQEMDWSGHAGGQWVQAGHAW